MALSDQDRSFFDSIGAGQPGGIPMPTLITAAEVKAKTAPLARDIFAEWQTLVSIIARHEATIQKRWIKKSKVKRRALLLEAWPGMAQCHRPDIAAWKKKRPNSTAVEANEDPYLWPYINLDDLSKTEPLLLMLKSRGRNAPDEFAAADVGACHFGIATFSVERPFLNCHVMMFRGQKTAETYGQLYSYDDHEDAFDWDMERRAPNPGEGLITLRVQARLYEFLVRCCKLILHDVTKEDLISGPTQPEPPAISANEAATGLTSLAAASLEAPYRLPAHIDFDRLQSVIGSRLAEAEDHLWALREDPSYFAQVMNDSREHSLECLPDTWGEQHPVMGASSQDIFWARVVKNALNYALDNVETLGVLQDKLAHLVKLKEKYEGSFSPMDNLPEPYELAFLDFEHFLKQSAKVQVQELRVVAPSSLPLRHMFVRLPNASATETALRVQSRDGIRHNSVEDNLLWVLGALWDERQQHILGLKTLTDELELMEKNSPEAKKLISPMVAKHISDLTLYAEALHQVGLYQPWANAFESHAVDHLEGIKSRFQQSLSHVARHHTSTSQNAMSHELVHLAKPTENRFHYPANKRASKITVAAMREAESNLDMFWTKYLADLRQRRINLPRVNAILNGERELQRTAEWTEPNAGQKEANVSPVDIDVIARPFGGIQINDKQPSIRSTEKTKTKTKGVAKITTEEAVDVGAVAEPERKITVDSRAAKVFSTFFFTPNASSQPGETNWIEFLHAMVTVGFTAEKLGGSAWQFTPTKLDTERAIQFHEPHPTSKIPFLMARRIGRRLWRAYGWHAGLFEIGA